MFLYMSTYEFLSFELNSLYKVAFIAIDVNEITSSTSNNLYKYH